VLQIRLLQSASPMLHLHRGRKIKNLKTKIKTALLIGWIGLTSPLYLCGLIIIMIHHWTYTQKRDSTFNDMSSMLYVGCFFVSILLTITLCIGVGYRRLWAFRLAKLLMLIGCIYALILVILYSALFSSVSAFVWLSGIVKIIIFLAANSLCFALLPWKYHEATSAGEKPML